MTPLPEKNFKLLHYAVHKFEIDFNKSYDSQYLFPGKPRGLYLSVDDAWTRWCIDNDFIHKLYNFVYEFELSKDSKILVIQTSDEMRRFLKTFEGWEEIKNRYDGIGFLNYVKIKNDLLFASPLWFDALDVNCYVIWNCEILEEKDCQPFNW